MATSLAEAQTMAAAAREASTVFMLEHRYLYDPVVQACSARWDRIGPATPGSDAGVGRTRRFLPPAIAKTGAMLDNGLTISTRRCQFMAARAMCSLAEGDS